MRAPINQPLEWRRGADGLLPLFQSTTPTDFRHVCPIRRYREAALATSGSGFGACVAMGRALELSGETTQSRNLPPLFRCLWSKSPEPFAFIRHAGIVTVLSGETSSRPARGRAIALLKVLGDEIRKARLAADLTQEELAARAKVTREYVSHVERGVYRPTVDVLIRLCAAMKTRAWKVLRRVERD